MERTCDNIIVLEAGRVTHEGSVTGFTQNTDILAVEIDSRHDEFIAALKSRDMEAQRDGNSVLVANDNGGILERFRRRSSRPRPLSAAWRSDAVC